MKKIICDICKTDDTVLNYFTLTMPDDNKKKILCSNCISVHVADREAIDKKYFNFLKSLRFIRKEGCTYEKKGWILKYVGRDKKPNFWSLNNKKSVLQIIFLNLVKEEDFKFIFNAIGI